MDHEQQRGIAEGLTAGVAAGVLFALAEMSACAVMGLSPLLPLRLFASVVMGRSALEAPQEGSVDAAGVIVHLLLSAFFGFLYGLLNGAVAESTRTDWRKQASLGLAFGGLLWVVTFQIIGRLMFPWFLESPLRMHLIIHAVFFGLPLGLMYAESERVRHLHQVH